MPQRPLLKRPDQDGQQQERRRPIFSDGSPRQPVLVPDLENDCQSCCDTPGPCAYLATPCDCDPDSAGAPDLYYACPPVEGAGGPPLYTEPAGVCYEILGPPITLPEGETLQVTNNFPYEDCADCCPPEVCFQRFDLCSCEPGGVDPIWRACTSFPQPDIVPGTVVKLGGLCYEATSTVVNTPQTPNPGTITASYDACQDCCDDDPVEPSPPCGNEQETAAQCGNVKTVTIENLVLDPAGCLGACDNPIPGFPIDYQVYAISGSAPNGTGGGPYSYLLFIESLQSCSGQGNGDCDTFCEGQILLTCESDVGGDGELITFWRMSFTFQACRCTGSGNCLPVGGVNFSLQAESGIVPPGLPGEVSCPPLGPYTVTGGANILQATITIS